jgi:hypothetical protein
MILQCRDSLRLFVTCIVDRLCARFNEPVEFKQIDVAALGTLRSWVHQWLTHTHLVTDTHQFPAKINVKMHLLVGVGPRAITTAERLQWGYGITAEVPAAYSIAPPKRGIQKVWLCRIECELHRKSHPVAPTSEWRRTCVTPALMLPTHPTGFSPVSSSKSAMFAEFLEEGEREPAAYSRYEGSYEGQNARAEIIPV